MLSFACLAMTLLPAPAHAGHWVFTTTASGQSTLNGTTQRTFYISPDPTTNSVSTAYALAAAGTYGPSTGTRSPVTETATSDLTLTVKAAWTADGNSDDTQPPDGIWFSEDTTATGTFSSNGGATQASTKVDDGFQDPITQSGDSIGTAAKVHYVKSSGGSVTTTLTASVTSTGTTGAAGGASASASIGPITISIHAQPYNFTQASATDFTQASATDNGDGSLTFTYAWSSTDGNLDDLSSCYLHERVTYPGGNPYTVPAPFSYPNSLPNPTVAPGTGTSGIVMTTTSNNSDTQHTWTPVAPYSNATVTAQQQYEYDDIATGINNTIVPGPGSGPFPITRSIAPRPPYAVYWWYSCTKQGSTAWLPLN